MALMRQLIKLSKFVVRYQNCIKICHRQIYSNLKQKAGIVVTAPAIFAEFCRFGGFNGFGGFDGFGGFSGFDGQPRLPLKGFSVSFTLLMKVLFLLVRYLLSHTWLKREPTNNLYHRFTTQLKTNLHQPTKIFTIKIIHYKLLLHI